MQKIFVLGLFLLAAITVKANDLNVNAYLVNDAQIEQLLTDSEDISLATLGTDLMVSQQVATAGITGTTRVMAGKEFVPALLLNLFLGGLGIHRLYLGTKTLTWVGYILTCGGIFGIVPIVDLVTLIIKNDDISPFVDNPKFFMWSNN